MPMSSAERTRAYLIRKQALWNAMPKIACACGCGEFIAPIRFGRPAKFVLGHNTRLDSVNRGKKLSPEEIARRTATRLTRQGGVYQEKRGWKHSTETVKRLTEINRRNARFGPENPFYGRTHSAESRQIMSEKLSGPLNAGWAGGVSSLPYGPEFTRKFKRLIRERDGYACVRCGRTKEQNGPRKKTLDIHHLDHDKINNDPTNVVTACHSCNVWASYHRDEPFVLHR